MRTLFRRLLKATALVTVVLTLLALVVVPVVAAVGGPMLLNNAGVHGQGMSVRADTSLAMLGGTVDALTISSGPIEIGGRFHSDEARVVLRDVNLLNNTFGSLSISANAPVATMASGEVVSARWLRAEGPAQDIVAQARFSKPDLLAITVLPAVSKLLGMEVTDLVLGDGGLTVFTASGSYAGSLWVDEQGRLLLSLDGAPPLVLWPASGPDAQDWALTSVSIDPEGITATAHFDGAAFLRRYPSLRDLVGGFVPSL